MPRLMILCGGRPDSSWPSNFIEPEVGANVPESMLKIVLLPEPFGPIRPRISPCSDLERHVVDGREAAEPFHQAFHDQHGDSFELLYVPLSSPGFVPAHPA